MQDLKASGKDAAYLPDVDAIVSHVAKNAQGGDIVVVFSNGGFGGIHGNCWSGWGGNSVATPRSSRREEALIYYGSDGASLRRLLHQHNYSTLKFSAAAPLDRSKSGRPAFKSVCLMTALLFVPSALTTAPVPEA